VSQSTTITTFNVTFFGDNKSRADLGRRSLRAAMLSIGSRALSACIQVASVVVLARLLSPVDYGLVSMMFAILGLAPLIIDLGTRDAIIQQRHISVPEISTLFWISVSSACSLAVIGILSGPVIAHFYGEPRLTLVATVFSISFIVWGLSYQHQALLRRAMKYRELAIVDTGASLISTVLAIVMAWRGWAYWALALRPVFVSLVTTLGLWYYCRWVPGRPVFSRGVKEMLQFGLHWLGYSATDFIGSFTDRIVIGRASGPAALGYYQKAALVYDNSLDLTTTPLHTVAMTALSKLREDRVQLGVAWSKALSTVAFFAMPLFGLLAVTSRDVVVLALGAKWTEAGILLGISALRGIPEVIQRTCGWLHNASGRADRFMRWGLLANGVQIAALFLGMPFGIRGIAWAFVAMAYLLFIPGIVYSGDPFGIGIRSVLKTIGPQAAGALIAVAAVLAVRQSLPSDILLRVPILVIVYLSVYAALVPGLFRVRTPFRVALSLFRSCQGLPMAVG
jgi:polysaccharide transporter, PST family